MRGGSPLLAVTSLMSLRKLHVAFHILPPCYHACCPIDKRQGAVLAYQPAHRSSTCVPHFLSIWAKLLHYWSGLFNAAWHSCEGARDEAAASCCDLLHIGVFFQCKTAGWRLKRMRGTSWRGDKTKARFETPVLCFYPLWLSQTLPSPPGGLFQLFITMSSSKKYAGLPDRCCPHKAGGSPELRLTRSAEWAGALGHWGFLCGTEPHGVSNHNY